MEGTSESDSASRSANSWESVGRRRKRKRQTVSRNSKMRRHRTLDDVGMSSTNKSKQKISNKQGFVCLYDLSEPHNKLPAYIKPKLPNAPILAVEEVVYNHQVFESPILDGEQEKRLKCFAECVEEMFGGLRIENTVHSSKWYEADKARNGAIRKQRIKSVVESYAFATCPDFALQLFHIYRAFTRGFGDAVSRKALEQIFSCCRSIMAKEDVNNGIYNVGGNSDFEGNSQIIPIKCDLGGFSDDELITAVQEQFKNVVEYDQFWVPDCVMYNDGESGDFEGFYFFGECKTGSVEKINMEMTSQVWHKSLRGLLGLSCVYGCGICTRFVRMFKLNITDSKVKTKSCNIDFRCDVTSDDSYEFFNDGFMEFIKIIMKVIQDEDNSNDT